MELGQVRSCFNELGKGFPGSLLDPTVTIDPQSLQCVDSGRLPDGVEEFYILIDV